MASKRDACEQLALDWNREAGDRERMAHRPEYSTLEKRLLNAQANVYRACANQLREVRHG